jgi:Uri superfamily endonuclease
MQVREQISIPFGRFKKGIPITIPAGECLYIGSAMNGLGRRLVRHATRSNHKPPHHIRQHMLEQFPATGLGKGSLLPAGNKKLHWNVDHLLDREQVELTHVIIIRSLEPFEATLGRFLEAESCTSIFEKGLGANDIPGNTHLLGADADETWWHSLPARLSERLNKESLGFMR